MTFINTRSRYKAGIDGFGSSVLARTLILSARPTTFKSILNVCLCTALVSVGVGIHPVLAQSTLSSWGRNDLGQLGNGTSVADSNTPVSVNSLMGVVAMDGGSSHVLAVRSDGTVWAWGNNNFGQLGNGTNTNSDVPVQVSGMTDVVAVAGGYYHSLALKRDGTVWGWGHNGYNSLGNGINTSTNLPVQASGLTGVVAIRAGSYHSLALKGDGTLWAWGNNQFGSLGTGGPNDPFNTPLPVRILMGVLAIGAGEWHSLAVMNDGTVRAWGLNNFGQLGNGTNTDSNTPSAVSGLTGVVAITGGVLGSHSVALKSDGTVWAWGNNQFGQLGNGTNIDSNTPVAVSALADVISIGGGAFHSLALKADGRVWGWGLNNYGQLGNCTYINSNTPVAVRGLTGVTTIAAEYHNSLALGNPPPMGACTNLPPVALCTNSTVAAGSTCTASASVNNGSTDPDGDPFSLTQSPAGPYPLGTTSVTLTATDSSALSSTCQAMVTVVDTTPPSVSSSVSQTSLWPPNHNLVNVGLTAAATDNCGATPPIGVSVFSNEADAEETGEGDFSPDAKDLGRGTLRLRAERKGNRAGRVYLIASRAADASGNTGFSCATVVVPLSLSSADQAAVASAASAARAFCTSHGGAPPSGYVQVGTGPNIGPKQ